MGNTGQKENCPITGRIFVSVSAMLLFALTGCGQRQKDRQFLTVDFKQDKPLRYTFVSERHIQIDIETPSRPDVGKKSQNMSEKLEMTVLYQPVRVEPFGLSTIRAVCESARVSRTSFTAGRSLPPDAAESFEGTSFSFQIAPDGRVEDNSQLMALAEQIGKKAFPEPTGRQGRVKNPDMIYDFLAIQLYLWEAITSVDKPPAGVRTGSKWKSTQFIPLPVQRPTAAEITYNLAGIEDSAAGRKADIECVFSLSNSEIPNWPMPYKGPYHLRGSLFSVLTNYQPTALTGSGRQVFNIDTGVLESANCRYETEFSTSFILPLGDSRPYLVINQKISIQLIE